VGVAAFALDTQMQFDVIAMSTSYWQIADGTTQEVTEALTLRLSRDLLDAIDQRRREAADFPTRPEMICRALVEWLELTKKG
jgi:hypothetical protein